MGGPGSGGPGEVNLFGEITKQGVQTGLGTIAGLGFGLPMSRLYARFVKPILPVGLARIERSAMIGILEDHWTCTLCMDGVSAILGVRFQLVIFTDLP